VHEIDGFTFTVNRGSWWEYKSVYDSSWITDTGSGSTHYETTFALVLGAPTTIDGDQAFPVTRTVIAATCSATGVNCVPDKAGTSAPWDTWSFLSFEGKRIRGSKDGQTYSVLFDANTSVWPTSAGFFGSFADDTGARHATQDPNNANQWDVAESSSANDCTNIPGYDSVCGPNGYSSRGAKEIFDPNVGCVGGGSGASGGSGGPLQNSSSITLVASSVDGSKPLPTSCPGYAPPSDTSGKCNAGVNANQPNGCYGGYYCDLSTNYCVAPPSSCGSGGGAPAGDGGAP
jgi:hypothetical protein